MAENATPGTQLARTLSGLNTWSPRHALAAASQEGKQNGMGGGLMSFGGKQITSTGEAISPRPLFNSTNAAGESAYGKPSPMKFDSVSKQQPYRSRSAFGANISPPPMISVDLQAETDDEDDAPTPRQQENPVNQFLSVASPPAFAIRSSSAPPLRDNRNGDGGALHATGLFEAQQKKSSINRVVSQPMYRPTAVRGTDDWLTEEEAQTALHVLPVAARASSAPVRLLRGIGICYRRWCA
jgi:hypothetical protein